MVALGKAHSQGYQIHPPIPRPCSGANPHGTSQWSSPGHWTCTGERERGRDGAGKGQVRGSGRAGARQGEKNEGKGVTGMSKVWSR